MELLIHQIKCNIEQQLTKREVAKKLRCKENDVIEFKIHKRSLDARDNLQYSYSVVANIKNASTYLRLKDVSIYKASAFKIPTINEYKESPVVIGFGPSGLFAALTLAYAGAKPIVYEMGGSMEQRIQDVDKFLKHRQLNTKSNIQYGEGGAGTFSDGKLTCRIKDERIPWILQQFIDAGAKENIAYDALPHIGTDQLQLIIPRLRQKIIDLGGQVFFNSQLSDVDIKNNTIQRIKINDKWINTSSLFLCAGHSNTSLYHMLYDRGVFIEQKDMAIGVRIEHPQDFINQARYHHYANHPLLEAASYNLTASHNGVGIYTFCMCPGGQIMASNCDEQTIVTNGMSYSKRDSAYANAALLVQTSKQDYGSDHPLAGFDYIHQLETKAFRLGGSNYDAPGCYVDDFMKQRISDRPIESTYSFNVVPTKLDALFSSQWVSHVQSALEQFNRKMKGYIHPQATMVAVESKSSCPIRVTRKPDTFQSISTNGLYPVGEGAGYAGGIISSALDGVKAALAYIQSQNIN